MLLSNGNGQWWVNCCWCPAQGGAVQGKDDLPRSPRPKPAGSASAGTKAGGKQCARSASGAGAIFPPGANPMPDQICLWEFPAADFPDWLALVGESECQTHADYQTLLAAIQADLERQGHSVIRVRMTVAEMHAGLAAKSWPNTPDNRAAVIALTHGGE